MINTSPLSIILLWNKKNKRFHSLAQDFFKSLYPFCISGLTKNIEKIISIDFKSIKTLKITHIWIFSYRKLSMFFHFSSIFSNRILSFEIIKFVLKKEFNEKRNFYNKDYKNIFLFLNNISEKSILGILLNKQLRKIIPVEKNKKVILKNNSKCILFDFDDFLEIMEFRCYSITNNNLLLPRKTRKLKKLKKIKKNYNFNPIDQKEYFNTKTLLTDSNRNNIKNIVRVIEIGPRITTKILNYI